MKLKELNEALSEIHTLIKKAQVTKNDKSILSEAEEKIWSLLNRI